MSTSSTRILGSRANSEHDNPNVFFGTQIDYSILGILVDKGQRHSNRVWMHLEKSPEGNAFQQTSRIKIYMRWLNLDIPNSGFLIFINCRNPILNGTFLIKICIRSTYFYFYLSDEILWLCRYKSFRYTDFLLSIPKAAYVPLKEIQFSRKNALVEYTNIFSSSLKRTS